MLGFFLTYVIHIKNLEKMQCRDHINILVARLKGILLLKYIWLYM